MSTEEPGKPPLSLRERRRAAATREIVDAAERHIDASGPAALSLRSVARDLGMTVQALYHYFPSRADLLTALIVKAYDEVADAVRDAVDAPAEDPSPPRLVRAAEGYRRWALTHPERFQLLYGTPLPHYQAPADGPTTRAMLRMARIFQHELFDGFTTAQLAAADAPALTPALRAHLEQLPSDGPGALPPPAAALLLDGWGHLHGLVVLEVFGHTKFLGDHQAEVFRLGMLNLLQDVHRRIPGTDGAPAADGDRPAPATAPSPGPAH
ncbi:TetR/AcrR family transcriptional regulator [Streptomyces sp. JNUCC 64]